MDLGPPDPIIVFSGRWVHCCALLIGHVAIGEAAEGAADEMRGYGFNGEAELCWLDDSWVLKNGRLTPASGIR